MEEISFNKITAEVITELAKTTAKNVLEKITTKYRDIVKKKILILVLHLKNI